MIAVLTIDAKATYGVVLAARGVVVIDESGGAEFALCTFDEEQNDSGMNDGKCDPDGRLLTDGSTG